MPLKADLILHNANIITMNPRQPRARALSVKNGRIMEAGDSSLVEKYAGSETRDCQGLTILPGFIDAHCHLMAFARSLLSLDLSPSSVRSIEEVKALVRKRAAQLREGEWVRGSGYHEFYFPEKRHPNRYDLDEAAPHNPAMLIHRSWHVCVLNSPALRAAGIAADIPDPPEGVIDRDPHTGEPTGVLYEMVPYVDRLIPSPTPTEMERGVALADEHYRKAGITSIQEASHSNDLARWEAIRGFQEKGLLRTAVTFMPGAQHFEEMERQGLRPGAGSEKLRLGPVKVMLTTTTGQMEPSQPELNEIVLRAHRGGWQVAIHSLEVETLEAAIIALEKAQESYPRPDHRHRIEHCSLCPPPLLERLRRLGAVIVTQPPFLYYSGDRYLKEVPEQARPWLYRIGSFFRAGLLATGSSDSPVVPNSPLTGVYSAVTRRTEMGRWLLREEGISQEQALAMYTCNAAHAARQEGERGSLEPGKLAEMVLLSADPTKVMPEEIKDIRVEMVLN